MTTRTTSRAGWHRSVWRGAMLLAAVLVVAVASLYAGAGEWDTAAGTLTGGGLVIAAAAVARWRTTRRAHRAGTADRVLGGRPDERDQHVATHAWAALGVAALLLSALAGVATSFGVEAQTVVSALPFVLIAVGVAAFVVVDRRS